MKWNNKEIIIRRTINDFHCCKILNLNCHFAKLRSSPYFPRGSPANKAACITCRRGGNVPRGGKPWETTVFLSCAVKHAPCAHSHASRALCEYQSSHEQRKLFEPKTSVSYWKLKSYVLLLFFSHLRYKNLLLVPF